MTLAGAATGRNASVDLHALQRGLEIVDVALQLGLPGVGDRPDADRVRPWSRRPRARRARRRTRRSARGRRRAANGLAAGLDRPALEAAQALEHVLRPADRLAELAVAHHVDAGLRLPAHDVGDRIGQAALIGSLVERLARPAWRAGTPAAAAAGSGCRHGW